MSRNVVCIALAVASVCSGGCGDRQVEVSGRVTYNGAALDKPGGKIVFVGPRGTQVVADVERDGTYRAAGVAAGPNQVAVYYPNPEAQKGRQFPQKGKPPPANVPQHQPFLTPYKYASAETSGLSVRAEKGAVFNAELTGPQIK
jgi:hypothetical protein